MTRQFTAIIEREHDAYVALCPELDVAKPGNNRVGCKGESKGGVGAVP